MTWIFFLYFFSVTRWFQGCNKNRPVKRIHRLRKINFPEELGWAFFSLCPNGYQFFHIRFVGSTGTRVSQVKVGPWVLDKAIPCCDCIMDTDKPYARVDRVLQTAQLKQVWRQMGGAAGGCCETGCSMSQSITVEAGPSCQKWGPPGFL